MPAWQDEHIVFIFRMLFRSVLTINETMARKLEKSLPQIQTCSPMGSRNLATQLCRIAWLNVDHFP